MPAGAGPRALEPGVARATSAGASLESYRIQSIHSLLCIVLTPMGLELMDPEVC